MWPLSAEECYVSVDVEADGRAPGLNSMLSLGAAAFDADGAPVMVAFPAAYDAMWVQWYLHRFVGDDPFRRRAVDLKTLAMVAMGEGYRATTKARMPRHWRPARGHSHVRGRGRHRAGRALRQRPARAQRPARRHRARAPARARPAQTPPGEGSGAPGTPRPRVGPERSARPRVAITGDPCGAGRP